MLTDQLLAVVAFSTPAALIVTLFAWWGLYSKAKRTPTRLAALRSLLASIVACVAYALARYQTPNDFFDNGATGVFIVALVVSAVMLIFFPGEPPVDGNGEGTAQNNSNQATKEVPKAEEKQMRNLSERIKSGWPVIALCSIIVSAWMLRYETVAAPFDRAPGMYVLDRWTGSVTLYTAAVYRRTIRQSTD
jgi:hypothetical protein